MNNKDRDLIKEMIREITGPQTQAPITQNTKISGSLEGWLKATMGIVAFCISLFGVYMAFTLADTGLENRVSILENNQKEIQESLKSIETSFDDVDDNVKNLINDFENFGTTFDQQVIQRFPIYLESLRNLGDRQDELEQSVLLLERNIKN